MAFGKGTGELGAQQEDLSGIVDPQQKHDQGAGRAVGGGNIALADIERDQILAALEQERRGLSAPIATSRQVIGLSGRIL